MTHDPMCNKEELLKIGVGEFLKVCQCDLIAKVRADEKEKIITEYLTAKQKAGIESFGGWPVTPFKGEQQ